MNENLIYAGFWSRLGATIVDYVIIILATLPALVLFYGDDYINTYWEREEMFMGPMDFFISIIFPAVYTIVLWSTKQATLGKMAVSAKIVDARTGGSPSVGQLIGRYFAYFISMAPLMLGILWIAFDKRKQGWHDKLSGTVVIRKVKINPEPVAFKS